MLSYPSPVSSLNLYIVAFSPGPLHRLAKTTTNVLPVASMLIVLGFLISLHPDQSLKSITPYSLTTPLSTLSTPCPTQGMRGRETIRCLTFFTQVPSYTSHCWIHLTTSNRSPYLASSHTHYSIPLGLVVRYPWAIMARLLNFARVLTADRIDSRAMRVVIDCREFSKAIEAKLDACCK